MYSSKNNQTTKKIYNLLDDIEEKLSKFNNSRRYTNNPSFYTNPLRSNENLRNIEQSNQLLLPNVVNNNNSEEIIRKIVNEEFNNLISSNQYINDKINSLDYKINNISDNFINEINNLKNQQMNIEKNFNDNSYIENYLNELKKSINQYVPYNEYIQKNEGIIKQINNIKDNMMLDNNNLNKKITELNLSLEEIKNKFNIFSNNYNNDMILLKQINNKISTNEININDLMNKNTLIQRKLDEQNKEMNDQKNEMIKINSIQNDLNIKLNTYLENSLKEKNDDKDINDLRENLNKTIYNNNLMSENINIINSNIDEIRQKIVKLETVKAEEISKIDMGKINEMYKQFEEIKNTYPKLYEYFEKYNVSISDLSTKLNKLDIEFENKTKKIYNQLNERIRKNIFRSEEN